MLVAEGDKAQDDASISPEAQLVVEALQERGVSSVALVGTRRRWQKFTDLVPKVRLSFSIGHGRPIGLTVTACPAYL